MLLERDLNNGDRNLKIATTHNEELEGQMKAMIETDELIRLRLDRKAQAAEIFNKNTQVVAESQSAYVQRQRADTVGFINTQTDGLGSFGAVDGQITSPLRVIQENRKSPQWDTANQMYSQKLSDFRSSHKK